MKKISMVVIAAAMAVSFVACGNKSSEATTEEETAPAVEETTVAPADSTFAVDTVAAPADSVK
ncbi:hypothetical protein [Parabacteroides sp. Marseille-P3160]|uniref:hypothetical protein n=1 Tax=Parabacteroides sp. Marseille-P3160 TaxID=1917887 RepID=UPI0009BB9775|nr:hypothetical protein [Parabacteroides sp. Marseille-P3160]